MATTLSSTEHQIIADLLGTDLGVDVFERMQGSGHNLLGFSNLGVDWVARWPKIQRPEPQWWQELSVQQIAAQYGIAPHAVASSPQTQSLLLPRAQVSNSGLDQAAQLIKRCHQLPKLSQPLDIQHAFHYWWNLCPPEHQPWQQASQRTKMQRAAQHFATCKTPLVQSHGDPVAANMLQLQGQPILIDWEYHCLAPLWWDLAIYAESQRLDDRSQHQLLQHYEPSLISDFAGHQLKVFMGIYADLAILWHCATMRSSNYYQTPQAHHV